MASQIDFDWDLPHKFQSQTFKRNLPLATAHPEVVEEYLQHEISMQRVAGTFPLTLVPDLQISRFGVIPKSHQINKWRLILNLSFPKAKSVNDGILKMFAHYTILLLMMQSSIS